jgi:hypothetical protein
MSQLLYPWGKSWVGLRAGLGMVAKRKHPCPCQELNAGFYMPKNVFRIRNYIYITGILHQCQLKKQKFTRHIWKSATA